MKHILKCTLCGDYSLKDKCNCGGKPLNPKPPKYSPTDKYSSYRRKAKESQLKEKNLL